MLAEHPRTIDPDQVIHHLKACLPAILAPYPVMVAYVYGSVAVGQVHPFSDIDIGLVLAHDHELTPYQRMQMEIAIASEIETACGLAETDVRTLNAMPLRFQGKVLTQGKLVYSRDEDFRVNYEVYTRKMYFDFQPVIRMMSEAYWQGVEADLKAKGLL